MGSICRRDSKLTSRAATTPTPSPAHVSRRIVVLTDRNARGTAGEKNERNVPVGADGLTAPRRSAPRAPGRGARCLVARGKSTSRVASYSHPLTDERADAVWILEGCERGKTGGRTLQEGVRGEAEKNGSPARNPLTDTRVCGLQSRGSKRTLESRASANVSQPRGARCRGKSGRAHLRVFFMFNYFVSLQFKDSEGRARSTVQTTRKTFQHPTAVKVWGKLRNTLEPSPRCPS